MGEFHVLRRAPAKAGAQNCILQQLHLTAQ